MSINRIGILGLGLIGGTLAKTIHRIHPDIQIVACDPNRDSLRQALSEGVIARGVDPLSNGMDLSDKEDTCSMKKDSALAALSSCRYIFLCAPVQQNEGFLKLLAPFLNEDCVLTDTGSVKASIHADIRARGLSRYFIGGHPMAGSEKSGYENATPYLFENAYYIITHDDEIDKALVTEYKDFIASLGCIPLMMSPTEHDYATAAVSHLPHILASSLVNLVQRLDSEQEYMRSIAAGGFKDITRIASSSPVMWQEICEANREQILVLLTQFIHDMEGIRTEISEGDKRAIHDFFQQAKDYRDSLPIQKNGSLPRIYEIYCDLIDEAGGIATIATILATNAISIKNIGIIHNREFEQGVLRIEFYGEEPLQQAIMLLRRHHYTVYER